MSICWYCHWGWPKQVRDIYDRAERDIDEALLATACEANDWTRVEEPSSGEAALEYGPAHVVWSDENFDLAESCLKDCDGPLYRDWHPPAMEIVRRSLRELMALPPRIRNCAPEEYWDDGEHPENFPPPPGVEMIKK